MSLDKHLLWITSYLEWYVLSSIADDGFSYLLSEQGGATQDGANDFVGYKQRPALTFFHFILARVIDVT